jgi:hypothetical protein
MEAEVARADAPAVGEGVTVITPGADANLDRKAGAHATRAGR